MAYIRLNGLGNGLGALGKGSAAQRGIAQDQAKHADIRKMLPEFNNAYNKIRSKAMQIAQAADVAKRALQDAEAELSSGDSFSLSFSDTGGVADIDDAVSEAQGIVEAAGAIVEEVKGRNIPDTWSDIGVNVVGEAYVVLFDQYTTLLRNLKALDAKFSPILKRISTVAQSAQRQIAQAAQRRVAEEARLRAQEQAELRRQQQEEARQRAAQAAEDRKLQAEYAAEQRRQQMELQREQQRAQMEAQYAAQTAAIEQAKAQAEQARLQAELQASMPQTPAYQAPVYQQPTQQPLYSPATTTTDAGYTDPSALFSQLLPASPQAMVVPQSELFEAQANSDWIDAESKAGGWNQGGAMWGMRGLGDDVAGPAPAAPRPKTPGQGGAPAAPKGTTPTRLPGGAVVTGNTGTSRRPRPVAPAAPAEANMSGTSKLALLAIGAYAAFRWLKRAK